MCMPEKNCWTTKIDIDKTGATRNIFADILRCLSQNKLGGGEGIEGLYGTLACGGMQKVLDCMAANCGLQRTSRLVDVGAGIGR